MNDLPVFLLDSDSELLTQVSHHFAARGLRLESFSDATTFLGALRQRRPGCIIMELHLPDKDGFDMQQHLISHGYHIPLIFLTSEGEADIATIVRAMRRGAHDCLVKPLDLDYLSGQVLEVFETARHQDECERQREMLRQRLHTLTDRENEILTLALTGKSNKEISLLLGISPRTVETHRSHLLEKIGIHNLLELTHVFTEVGQYLASDLTAPHDGSDDRDDTEGPLAAQG